MKRFVTLIAALSLIAGNACAWSHGAVPLPIIPSGGSGWASATTPEGGACTLTIGSDTNQCPTPAAVGNPSDWGYGDNVIGMFIDVPFQTVTGSQDFYVVAWHPPSVSEYAAGVKSNIDHVSCSTSGAWVSVYATSAIPGLAGPGSSELSGYRFTLRASDYSDGAQEIRCIEYPTTGKPVVLQGSVGAAATRFAMPVNTNSHGTLPGPATTGFVTYVALTGSDTANNCRSSAAPCATIGKAIDQIYSASGNTDVGGGTVCLQAGTTYPYGALAGGTVRQAATQWLAIQPTSLSPCDGVNSGSVVFATLGAARVPASKIHLRNVQLGDAADTSVGTNCSPAAPCSTTEVYMRGTSTFASSLWADGVTYVGPGTTVVNSQPNFLSSFTQYVACTDMTILSAESGCLGVNLVRNTVIRDIGSEAQTNVQIAIGNTVKNVGVVPCCNYHPDFFQVGSSASAFANVILYGVTGTQNVDSQGPFINNTDTSLTDMAIVNTQFVNGPNARYIFLGQATTNANVMFLNSSFNGPSKTLFGFGTTSSDITVVDSTCPNPLGVAAGSPAPKVYGSSSC